ncbi:NUDIX domain-containing protein [Nocardia yunnanensis]|uniref:8-oxo-dGTP diphosphatase n=1 Tax=Nocardia yunnanensis TaxID=2382165 RepID=A0A386ZL28_9NOCA|nr:NUDIX domain-containing protein [Nocardia yunnanensis]AYF78166.1 NUDIX domain-containing protein [Nocardia yunnanensis]
MAREGTQILMINAHDEVLMYLRDDFPHIPYPNMWAIPGGMLEAGETPHDCVIREIKEEMDIALDPNRVVHAMTHERDFGIEHSYATRIELDIEAITLTEGQRLKWFTRDEAAATRLAYADNQVIEEFFEESRHLAELGEA